jgi:hypothetical protein
VEIICLGGGNSPLEFLFNDLFFFLGVSYFVFEAFLTELSFFPSTNFSPILLKGIPYQDPGRFKPARVRVMNNISEYHLIEKYK